MLPLIIGLLLIIAGLGTVAWLMWNEKKQFAWQEAQANNEKDSKPDLTPASLLKKLGLEEEKSNTTELPVKKNIFSKFLSSLTKKIPKQDSSIPTPLSTKLPEEFSRVSSKNTTGTASLRLDQDLSFQTPPKETAPAEVRNPSLTGLEAESDWAFRYDELQKERDSLKEKFERLDSLFKEKGDSFDKSEKALVSEIKNRKEFNKVKDLLEKELKEMRDKCRELEVRVSGAQTESSAYLKRVNQLEEKIKKLEKEILDKENEMKEAQGQIQGRQKLIADLEEKLKANEKLIQEKNEKINEIVGKMKEGGTTPSSASSLAEKAPDAPAAEPAPPVAEAQPSPAVEIPPPEEAVTVPETPDSPADTSIEAPRQEKAVESAQPAMPQAIAPEYSVQVSAPEPASTQTEQTETPQKESSSQPAIIIAEPPAPAAQPTPTEESAQTAPAGEAETAPDRGNIILQAIEKDQQPAIENSPKVETPVETKIATTEPEIPSSPSEENTPNPEPAPESTSAPQETPVNNPENTPTIKLAPDILAEQPKGTEPENPSASEKTEPPNAV